MLFIIEVEKNTTLNSLSNVQEVWPLFKLCGRFMLEMCARMCWLNELSKTKKKMTREVQKLVGVAPFFPHIVVAVWKEFLS